jgi:RimJ/RimL family protein N-acetyltransferase
VIQTDRLILRPAVDADRDAIAAINADPEVGAWLGGVRDRAESDAFVDRVQAHDAEHGFGFWVVERKADVAGDRHDRRLVGPTRDPLPDQVEIGWRFAPDAWGQGYATEAARAALDYGFETLSSTRSSPSRRARTWPPRR